MRQLLYPITNLALISALALILTAATMQRSDSLTPTVLEATTADPSSEPLPPPSPMPVRTKATNVKAVQATSFLVYDHLTGSVLVERNSDEQYPIASLTKLLTAYVVYKQSAIEDVVTVPAKLTTISPVLGLRPGDQITIKDLLNASLIGSANDAAQLLASYLSEKTGQSFPNLMNDAAIDLGMWYSHFSNAIGFDEGENYATGKDLMKLTNAIQQYELFQATGRATHYTFNSVNGRRYSIRATNVLINRDPEISAIKTGFTDEARGAMITKIDRQGHSFIVIVLRSPNREQDTLALKKAVIDSYVWK